MYIPYIGSQAVVNKSAIAIAIAIACREMRCFELTLENTKIMNGLQKHTGLGDRDPSSIKESGWASGERTAKAHLVTSCKLSTEPDCSILLALEYGRKISMANNIAIAFRSISNQHSLAFTVASCRSSTWKHIRIAPEPTSDCARKQILVWLTFAKRSIIEIPDNYSRSNSPASWSRLLKPPPQSWADLQDFNETQNDTAYLKITNVRKQIVAMTGWWLAVYVEFPYQE